VSASQRPVQGVIVTHGRLGEELLRTAELIIGPQKRIAVISNVDRSHQSLSSEIERYVSEALDEGARVVLLADLGSGGCGRACAAVTARYPDALLACGVNLPMLLEFLYHRDRAGPAELKDRLLRKGREGVSCSGWDEVDAG
jgi:mannose/fructose-specific phosphotransferase system component IIA